MKTIKMSEDISSIISSTHFELTQDHYMNPLYDRSKDENVNNTNTTQNTLPKQIKSTSEKNVSQLTTTARSTLTKSVGSSNIANETPTRCCPTVNCPEKIVICLDISSEMDNVTFRSKSGDKFAPLKIVKRALGMFIHTKHRMNQAHEFALVLLRDNAVWVCEFTNKPEKIITIMNEMKDTSSCETFDLTSLFDTIRAHAVLPQVDHAEVVPPPYILRVILIYGRSCCRPAFTNPDSLKLLFTSPHFFLDCYYIHEPPSEENQCEEIYDQICALDTKGLSYIFEVSRNPTKLYDAMAQLLAHPLQRPLQGDLSHSIEARKDDSPPK